MRSIAPWRHTIFSQGTSPSSSTISSTTSTTQRPLVLVRCGTKMRLSESAIFTFPANPRQAYHSHEESLLPAQPCSTSTVNPYTNLVRFTKRKSGRDIVYERFRFFFDRQKEQLLAEVRTEIHKHDFQADFDRRILKWNEIVESQRREIHHTIASDEQFQATSITTSRITVRTKSGFLWRSHQKSSWDWRLEESSRVTIRWFFYKKTDRKSGHY